MQNHSRKYLVLAFFAALTGASFCLGKDDTTSPEFLLSQARKLHDVWSDGTPPVKMRAEIAVLDAKGETVRGQYFITWISPSHWREEIEIANYKRLRVFDSKGYWQQSTLSVQPEIIFQLDSILDIKAVLKIGTQTLGKVKTRDKDRVRQKCTEVKWPTGTERVLCFDEASGDLLSVEYPRSEYQNPPEISRVVYGAFNTLGNKHIPYEMQAFHDRIVVVTIKVTELTPITESDSKPFDPPANSEFWRRCDDLQGPELVNKVQPRYPANARSNREQGRVVFYGVIEADGSLSHLTLIQRATPALESAASDAIRQWHYKPATCGSSPIRLETSIPVDFWLQY